MILLPEDKNKIAKLDPSDVKDLLLALLSEPGDLPPNMSVAADILYTVIYERNTRMSEKQSKNGSKGGRPRKSDDIHEIPSEPEKPNETQTKPNKPNETQTKPNKPNESQVNPTEAKKASVSDTVSVSVSVSESVSVKNAGNTGASAPTRARFTPPTVDEVAAYCQERGNGVDAQHWHDYYTSNGWLVGKNKMRDWKATVRTWEKNGYSNTPRGQTGKGGAPPESKPATPDAAELKQMKKLLSQIKGDDDAETQPT